MLLVFAGQNLFAQPVQFHFNRIDTRNGISNNQVNTIFKDDKGFMWFGTMSGINRYDGYKFQVFRNIPKDSTSISDNYISEIMGLPEKKMLVSTRNGFNVYDPVTEKFDRNTAVYFKKWNLPRPDSLFDIKKDKAGNFWFLFSGSGLFCYYVNEHKTVSYSKQIGTDVSSFTFDQKGNIWVIKRTAIIQQFDLNRRKIFQSDALQAQIGSETNQFAIFSDADDDLWIRALHNPSGVFYYSTIADQVDHYHSKASSEFRLASDIIEGIIQDKEGTIWIASDHGGLNLIDKKNRSIRYILNDPYDNKSISQNSINCIYRDEAGIIWLGTYKRGLSYFNQSLIKFPLVEYKVSDKGGLTHGDVNRFIEDEHGNLWIGTDGGGLIYYDRKNNKFTTYKHSKTNSNSLSNDVIISLCIDRQKRLWIGTYFGGLNSFDGNKFTHFRHNPKDSATIIDDRVYSIMQDSNGQLWVGTFSGLDRLDPGSNKFHHYRAHRGPGSLSSNLITAIKEDKSRNLWVSTAYGLNMMDPQTGAFTVYRNNINDTNTISKNNVICVETGRNGWIWIGTREGLNILDPTTKKIKRVNVSHGLPDNTIRGILEDRRGNIWVSTPNGLSKISISDAGSLDNLSVSFENFNELHNLQAHEFNENAAIRLRTGELAFGGPNGFNIFYPERIIEPKTSSSVVISDFQIFNQSVKAGAMVDGRLITELAIPEANQIVLKYHENVFAIEFAALNFSQNLKQRYSYKLEGFNDGWMTTDGSLRRATYTNLDPGTYSFKVRAEDNAGNWSEPVMLKIIVKPPFWRTPWAFMILTAFCILALYLARRFTLERAHLRYNIAQQKREAERMHELDMLKIKFFTNVSHEFRTPISLIMAPVDKMLRQAKEPGHVENLNLIKRNARRLLNMVNQLLDFRKLEEQELSLSPARGDVIEFIKDTSLSFVDIAESKQIDFSFHSNVDSFHTYFDHGKLERILFNLISNAFKFTHEYGQIEVVADIQPEGTQEYLELRVKDTGIGIDKEKQDKIFEQFFQTDTPSSIANHGSGIGLSITKEFVQLHHGTIEVESEVNRGSTFIVTIPLTKVDSGPPLTTLEPNGQQAINGKPAIISPVTVNESPVDVRRKTILLVEDNEDFRFYLKDNLKAYYNVIEAQNGKIGWQKALSQHPDLIVSDINMPELNGIDLSKKLKSDQRTLSIPVILLTALTGDEYHIQSLNTGADDYMAKPFNFEILLSKINNFLSQQDKLRKTYQRQVQIMPNEVILEKEDNDHDKFIKEAFDLVEKNLSNIEFSVEEMSRKLHMSRAGLYKKIFTLTGKTPIEFVREIRLQKAARLLESGKMTISEVAYEVGFNPKSFTKNFKAFFKMLPSEFQEKVKNEN